MIDVGTQAGANEIRDVQFLLSNQQPVRAQALREAVLAARGDAQALAEALDLKITRVSLVDDTETTGGLEKLDRMFKRSVPEPAQTPMVPGTIDITATVTLTVEVGATSR